MLRNCVLFPRSRQNNINIVFKFSTNLVRSGCDLERLSFSLLSFALEHLLLAFLESSRGGAGARGDAGGVGPRGVGDWATSLAKCFNTDDWLRKSSGISVIS